MESGGADNKFPDYLLIENSSEKIQQYGMPRLLIKTNNSISLKFITDWITTETLAEPKGVLLYFKSI